MNIKRISKSIERREEQKNQEAVRKFILCSIIILQIIGIISVIVHELELFSIVSFKELTENQVGKIDSLADFTLDLFILLFGIYFAILAIYLSRKDIYMFTYLKYFFNGEYLVGGILCCFDVFLLLINIWIPTCKFLFYINIVVLCEMIAYFVCIITRMGALENKYILFYFWELNYKKQLSKLIKSNKLENIVNILRNNKNISYNQLEKLNLEDNIDFNKYFKKLLKIYNNVVLTLCKKYRIDILLSANYSIMDKDKICSIIGLFNFFKYGLNKKIIKRKDEYNFENCFDKMCLDILK